MTFSTLFTQIPFLMATEVRFEQSCDVGRKLPIAILRHDGVRWRGAISRSGSDAPTRLRDTDNRNDLSRLSVSGVQGICPPSATTKLRCSGEAAGIGVKPVQLRQQGSKGLGQRFAAEKHQLREGIRQNSAAFFRMNHDRAARTAS
jgi:hypothetical protein